MEESDIIKEIFNIQPINNKITLTLLQATYFFQFLKSNSCKTFYLYLGTREKSNIKFLDENSFKKFIENKKIIKNPNQYNCNDLYFYIDTAYNLNKKLYNLITLPLYYPNLVNFVILNDKEN